eukprot:gene16214-22378_t
MADGSPFCNAIDCRTVTVGQAVYRVQSGSRQAQQRRRVEKEAQAPIEYDENDDEPSCNIQARPEEGLPSARRAGVKAASNSTPQKAQTGSGDSRGAKPEAEESGNFSDRVSCDPEIFPMLIGVGGATRKRIESDSGAKITVPGRDQKGDITIKATSHHGDGSPFCKLRLSNCERWPSCIPRSRREELRQGRQQRPVGGLNIFPMLIGVGGATRKRIESDSGAKITVPGRDQKGDITIKATSQ